MRVSTLRMLLFWLVACCVLKTTVSEESSVLAGIQKLKKETWSRQDSSKPSNLQAELAAAVLKEWKSPKNASKLQSRRAKPPQNRTQNRRQKQNMASFGPLKLKKLLAVTRTSAKKSEEITQGCNSKIDVGFIIGGCGTESFEPCTSFAKTVINNLRKHNVDGHYGLILFSKRAKIIIGFEENQEQAEVMRELTAIKYKENAKLSKIKTGKALQLANDLFTNARKDSKKIVLLFTGGKASDDVVVPSQQLKSSGVSIFSMGLGSEVEKTQLEVIANTPSNEFVYSLDPDGVSAVTNRIITSFCEEPKKATFTFIMNEDNESNDRKDYKSEDPYGHQVNEYASEHPAAGNDEDPSAYLKFLAGLNQALPPWTAGNNLDSWQAEVQEGSNKNSDEAIMKSPDYYEQLVNSDSNDFREQGAPQEHLAAERQHDVGHDREENQGTILLQLSNNTLVLPLSVDKIVNITSAKEPKKVPSLEDVAKVALDDPQQGNGNVDGSSSGNTQGTSQNGNNGGMNNGNTQGINNGGMNNGNNGGINNGNTQGINNGGMNNGNNGGMNNGNNGVMNNGNNGGMNGNNGGMNNGNTGGMDNGNTGGMNNGNTGGMNNGNTGGMNGNNGGMNNGNNGGMNNGNNGGMNNGNTGGMNNGNTGGMNNGNNGGMNNGNTGGMNNGNTGGMNNGNTGGMNNGNNGGMNNQGGNNGNNNGNQGNSQGGGANIPQVGLLGVIPLQAVTSQGNQPNNNGNPSQQSQPNNMQPSNGGQGPGNGQQQPSPSNAQPNNGGQTNPQQGNQYPNQVQQPGGQPNGGQPSGGQPNGGQPNEGQSNGGQPSGGQPSGGSQGQQQPSTSPTTPPTGQQSTASTPHGSEQQTTTPGPGETTTPGETTKPTVPNSGGSGSTTPNTAGTTKPNPESQKTGQGKNGKKLTPILTLPGFMLPMPMRHPHPIPRFPPPVHPMMHMVHKVPHPDFLMNPLPDVGDDQVLVGQCQDLDSGCPSMALSGLCDREDAKYSCMASCGYCKSFVKFGQRVSVDQRHKAARAKPEVPKNYPEYNADFLRSIITRPKKS